MSLERKCQTDCDVKGTNFSNKLVLLCELEVIRKSSREAKSSQQSAFSPYGVAKANVKRRSSVGPHLGLTYGRAKTSEN